MAATPPPTPPSTSPSDSPAADLRLARERLANLIRLRDNLAGRRSAAQVAALVELEALIRDAEAEVAQLVEQLRSTGDGDLARAG